MKIRYCALFYRYKDDWPVELREELTIVVDSPSNYQDKEIKVISSNESLGSQNPSSTDEIKLKVVVRQRNDTGLKDSYTLVFFSNSVCKYCFSASHHIIVQLPFLSI